MPASNINGNIWAREESQSKGSGDLTPSTLDKSHPKTLLQIDEGPASNNLPDLARRSRLPYARNPDFFGREDILFRLDEHLLPKHDQAPELQKFALYGLGGIGKTQIAVEYAISRSEKFDVVFWVTADSEEKIAESFGHIATQLGLLKGFDTLDRVVSRNLVLEWLSDPRKRTDPTTSSIERSAKATWLMVFDNADDIHLLRDYWPIGARGSILVTSRDPIAKTDLHPGNGMDVPPFDKAEAAFLLRKLTVSEVDEESTQYSLVLAQRLGGLALAVVQVAALIRRMEMTLKEFVEYYEEQTSLANLGKTEFQSPREYSKTIFTVWTFDTLTQPAETLLNLFALFDPDCIQESIVTAHLPKEVDDDFPTTKMTYLGARTELLSSSMIRRHRLNDQITLHRLVQEAARSRMDKQQFLTTFVRSLNILSEAWPSEREEFSYDTTLWAASDLVLPHVLQLQQFFDAEPRPELTIAQLKSFAKLLQTAGWYVVNILGTGPESDVPQVSRGKGQFRIFSAYVTTIA